MNIEFAKKNAFDLARAFFIFAVMLFLLDPVKDAAAKLLLEAFDTTGRVDEFLLAREERVAH